MHGISAVDIALWDIACKAANAPVHRLLGGGDADLVRYASLVSYSDASIVRASVRRAIDDGFSSLKLHEIKLSAIHAAREEAGAEVELMLDGTVLGHCTKLEPERKNLRNSTCNIGSMPQSRRSH